MLAGSGGALAFITYVFTDNLSTAIIIFGITIGLIFIAHPKVRPFLIAAGILLVVAIVAISFLSATMETEFKFPFDDESLYGCIRRIMHQEMAIRRYRHCMRLDQEGFWEEDLETVSRSSEVYRKRRTI